MCDFSMTIITFIRSLGCMFLKQVLIAHLNWRLHILHKINDVATYYRIPHCC